MPPKHPYTKNGVKILLLNALDYKEPITRAAESLKINIKTARGIKRRADKISNDSSILPSVLNLKERAQIAPKPGKHRVLSEVDLNTLDRGIRQDRKHRDMYQWEVAQELGLKGCKETIRLAGKKLRYSRCKPTKKPDLTEDQEWTRYNIAFDRKWKEHWTLVDYKLIAYSDEAAILVGEHRGPNSLSRKLEEKYDEDCIEVRFGHYSSAMFWGAYTYDFKCKYPLACSPFSSSITLLT